MKRFLLFVSITLAVIFVASQSLVAQDPASKVVFVDAQAAIAAHPAGEQAATLQEQARQEIGALQTDLQAIAERVNAGAELTPDEQLRVQQLGAAVREVQQRYTQQIDSIVQPALEAVNAAISSIAAENGYDIVLDSVVAGAEPMGINLVVYAREDLNITPLVIERIRASQ
jgi:Skp family chaperone for outer membrane proteins